MNQAHYHLLLNHLPIIITIVGLLLLIGGFIFRSEVIKRASFSIFVIAALSAIAAFATGDGAEDAIEHLPGISKQLIHSHEETAETFSILTYILGVTSLLALWANWKQKPYSKVISLFIIVFSIVVIFFAKQTGTTGGVIRHSEIRTDSPTNQSNGNKVEDDK